MARRRKDSEGYGRLLDAWVAPREAGEPVGCIATSFTFQPEHFEEECLGRFLRLESDRDEDGPMYLLEFEEKASQIACAAALVDQHHCRAQRSLRWDLLAVRLPGRAIQHAKVALLHWSNRVRIIVASANLTADGYRRNREVFGVLDYRPGSSASRGVLLGTVTFLEQVLTYTGDPAAPATERCRRLLDRVRKLAPSWSGAEGHTNRQRVQVVPVFTGPGRTSALEQVEAAWPSQAPRRDAWVVSPFFDPPEAPNRAAAALWKLLAPSGEAHVRYCLEAEDLPRGKLRVHAPRSLLTTVPQQRRGAQVSVLRLEADDAARPLHLKALWVESAVWAGYLIGSSNFTTAGQGCGSAPNLEANLLYLTHLSFCREGFDALNSSFPRAEGVDLQAIGAWQAVPDEDTAADEGVVLLPEGFQSVTLAPGTGAIRVLRFRFGANLPAGWWLAANEAGLDAASVYDQARWQKDGQPPEVILPWSETLPPYGFTVFWDAPRSGAWWPVNIESGMVLPPPAELRDLPLELLLDILTAARPLHLAMAGWLRRRRTQNGADPVSLDPHKRVNTTAFLLQRTRRVAWALAALRERLARPVATEESLAWRLYGPIGVVALATALIKEARSESEKSFLVCELAVTLARVVPQEAPGCLPRKKVRAALGQLVQDLHRRVQDAAEMPENLRRYVTSAFEELGV